VAQRDESQQVEAEQALQVEEPHAVMSRQEVLAPAAVMPTVAVATQPALSAEETVQEHSCSVVILAELAEIALAALDEMSGSAASPALSELRQGVWQPACRVAELAGTHQERLFEEAERPIAFQHWAAMAGHQMCPAGVVQFEVYSAVAELEQRRRWEPLKACCPSDWRAAALSAACSSDPRWSYSAVPLTARAGLVRVPVVSLAVQERGLESSRLY
jgi:hypothetical protein